MKNKMMFNFKFRNVAMACAVGASIFMFSCQEDAVAPNEAPGNDAEAMALSPKTLAAIEFSNGSSVVFKSEADGIVYEAQGNGITTDKLINASMLERFLMLTDASVMVPEDLISMETNEAIKEQALARGTVSQHENVIHSSLQLTNASEESSVCSGNSYYDTDAYGQYYRSFNGYPWGIAGCTVYSSTKSGADKCKTVNLNLTNCTTSHTLSADTWYKNTLGNYVRQDVINVGAGDTRFWSKTYISKRYRRVFVSGYGSGTFGGYVLFRDY